ncbi:Transcription factor TFIIIB component B [Orbilia oligospora]|uniref:Transcription factor TFIIIB component B n=3 Tax=Orbilia oligospora TaxID=2813651 RepID=A0A6G1LVN1_ORBOL|nr:Transcription factor TFIIIB component B [Orbilia oligospora]KAF3219848.1 Transcription factor TFIIIB component B [Orbilia oligospora]KAF3233865.1 Transcription factor TFIIIB component B [Orbilia oligospora]
MSFINKSSKRVAPKKPQNRGGGASSLNPSSTTPSSTEHTASPAPAPPALATSTTLHPEPRASPAKPSITIATKPLPPTEDATISTVIPTPSITPDTQPHRRSLSPVITRRDVSNPPSSPQLQRAKPAAPRRAAGIPISMPGASRGNPISMPTTRPRSPEVHRIQPVPRKPSRERSEETISRNQSQTPIPAIVVSQEKALTAPSPVVPKASHAAPALAPTLETVIPDASGTDTTITTIAKSTTKPRKRKRPATDNPEGDSTDPAAASNPRPKRGRKPKTTPQNAENLEIEPTVVRMTDLCRDTFIGKKSKLYEEIEKIDWLDVVKKQRARKAEIEARRAAGEDVQLETVEQRLDRLGRENASARGGGGAGGMAPQMRIVNGQLVLDETSVQVDRRERDVGADGPLETIEESNLTRRVNSATWSKREKTERWDDEETERFYQALGMFGTDFEMMSKMFMGRSRRMLKNKFVVEERRNPRLITAALKKKVPVDMAEYSKLAAREFGDVEEVESQLRKIREEHEKGMEAAAAENSALTKERNEAALAELAKAANGETTVSHQPDLHSGKRSKKGKGKFVSKQSGDSGEVVMGSIEDFAYLRQ